MGQRQAFCMSSKGRGVHRSWAWKHRTYNIEGWGNNRKAVALWWWGNWGTEHSSDFPRLLGLLPLKPQTTRRYLWVKRPELQTVLQMWKLKDTEGLTEEWKDLERHGKRQIKWSLVATEVLMTQCSAMVISDSREIFACWAQWHRETPEGQRDGSVSECACHRAFCPESDPWNPSNSCKLSPDLCTYTNT